MILEVHLHFLDKETAQRADLLLVVYIIITMTTIIIITTLEVIITNIFWRS